MPDELPVNSRVEVIDRSAERAPLPTMGGPDWTREYNPSGKLLNEAPNSRVNEMVFASAFGRAKGKLLDAFAFDDPLERERQIDAVVLTLVGLAFLEPDAHTILERLT